MAGGFLSGTHFPNRSVLMTRIVSPTQPAASRPADDLWYRIFQLRYCRRGCGARSNSGNDRSNRGSTGATHTGTHSYVAPGNGLGRISRNCAKTDATTYSLVTAGSASNKNKSLGTIRVRITCRGGGMADAADLKFVVRKDVRVRLPPSAPVAIDHLLYLTTY